MKVVVIGFRGLEIFNYAIYAWATYERVLNSKILALGSLGTEELP